MHSKLYIFSATCVSLHWFEQRVKERQQLNTQFSRLDLGQCGFTTLSECLKFSAGVGKADSAVAVLLQRISWARPVILSKWRDIFQIECSCEKDRAELLQWFENAASEM